MVQKVKRIECVTDTPETDYVRVTAVVSRSFLDKMKQNG